MSGGPENRRTKRQAWTDRWLLDAFRERVEPFDESDSPALSSWEALEACGIPHAEILQVVQDMSGAKGVDVSTLGPEHKKMLSSVLAERYDVVPVRMHGRTLEVASANPLGNNCERDLAFACGQRVTVRVAGPAAIRKARERVYGVQALPGRDSRIAWITPDSVMPPVAAPTRGVAVDLLDRLVLDALDQRASDMHFEPADGELLVRYRIDGVLHEIARVPADHTPLLLSRLKVSAGLDIANRMRPQDGRCSLMIDGRPIDLRVSTLPLGERVEKAVVRILDASCTTLSFDSLGFDPSEVEQLSHILTGTEGMVLVTGPTGSGKTTTLYTALRHMKSSETNIVTVEDPIEYRLEGVNQVQVNERAGLTFASALRSILRQDPDVVLVGEIRDVETAAIAIRASMTGHMVLSTLHTNDASSAIGRLADMGVDMSALSGALKAVIAQRLVRRLCTECHVPMRLQDIPHELQWLFKDRDLSNLRGPLGCAACRGTGFRGRISIAEIFVIDNEIQQLMGRSTQRLEFLQLARKNGMHTLWETGLERVIQGLTSFAELVANVMPPIPDADLQQEDVDRLLADIIGTKSKREGAGTEVVNVPAPALVRSRATPALSAAMHTSREPVREAPPPQAVEVSVRRPMLERTAGARLVIAPRRESVKGPRILIVQEDRAKRREMRKAFMRASCVVTEAVDGDAALAYACRLRPDAVVTDIALSGLDGLGLVQLLLSEDVVRNVFVYTDQQDEALLAWARELGARDALTMDDDPDTLATLVCSELYAVETVPALLAG